MTTTTLVPVDRDEVRWPVIQALPYETTTWKVDFRVVDNQLILRITLTPIVNRAEQAAERRTALREAKRAVLTWLATKGAAPGTYGVVWAPPEAADL